MSAAQLSLWEPAPIASELETHIVPFRWADGDTSEQAAQRMFADVQGHTHYLWGWDFINGRLVCWYANVLDAWIEQGVVWARCIMTPEGRYVNEMRAGIETEGSEDEE